MVAPSEQNASFRASVLQVLRARGLSIAGMAFAGPLRLRAAQYRSATSAGPALRAMMSEHDSGAACRFGDGLRDRFS